MTNPNEALLSLADRVERLTNSGGMEIVADIYEALGYRVKRQHERIGIGRFSAAWKWFDPIARRWVAMERFTASVDAAMKLVPDEHEIRLETAKGSTFAYANVWHDTPDYDGTAPNESRAYGAPQAITAASLRALSHTGDRG